MNKNLLLFLCLFLCLITSISGNLELVGKLSKEEILKHFPDWQEEASSYFPKLEMVEKLNSIDYYIKIECFLGTWCSDCKEHVSSYFKIMEMADNPLISSTYIGIPRDKEPLSQPLD